MNDLERWTRISENTLQELLGGIPSPIKERLLQALTEDASGMSSIAFDILKTCDRVGVQVASSIWQICNLFAKFRGDGSISKEMKQAAVTGYVSRNNRAREVCLPPAVRREVRELLNAVLPPIEGSRWRFGPGSVMEHFDAFKRWGVVSAESDPAVAIAAEQGYLLDHSPACRLCAVHKNAKKARLITVESSLASFWQQHLRQSLLESIHCGPLAWSIEDQFLEGRPEEYQRRRCLRASGSGACSTLDLKDASDSIPWTEVQNTFPAWCVHDMAVCRSEFFQDSTGLHPIFMYAGMGNASTFAVETLYFWAVFTACAKLTFGSCDLKSVSVFGDDVVIPSRYAMNAYYLGLVADCGLLINDVKSCISDSPGLREACGLAAYYGEQIAEPVMVKGPYTFEPDDISMCELVTRLDLSTVYGMGHLATDLIDLCDLSVIHTPSPCANISAVTASAVRPERGRVPKRWRSSLQLWEYRLKTRIPVKRSYRLHDLGPCQALAVLSGQVGTQRVRKGRVEIEIDLPHQTRTAWRWVRFYPDPTSLYSWVPPSGGVSCT